MFEGESPLAENAVYECLFLLDSNHYARDPAGTANLVDEMLTEAGGEVLVSRMWAEQKLAYPVEGHRKGTYWLAYFRMPGPNLAGFNRACAIHDTILRHMVLKVDPRLAGTLVAHARGESVAPEEPETAEPGGATEIAGAAEAGSEPSGEGEGSAEPAPAPAASEE